MQLEAPLQCDPSPATRGLRNSELTRMLDPNCCYSYPKLMTKKLQAYGNKLHKLQHIKVNKFPQYSTNYQKEPTQT